jgi:hypothetical protein
MTQPKPNRRRILLIVLGMLVVLALAGYWILRSIAIAVFSSDSATPTAAEYAAWVKLEIPATVQNWRSYGEGFQDWYVQARFELPLEELPKFLNDNKLELAPNLTQPPENVFKQSWFDPKPPLEVYELKSSETQQASTASGFYPTVYLERSGSIIVVYIVAFDT